MSKLFAALVGLSMLGLVGAASAAEPVTLTEDQLDSVAAGLFNSNVLNVGGIGSGGVIGAGCAVSVCVGNASIL